MNRDIQRITIERLDAIETSIQAFYLLVDVDKGQKLIEHLNDIRKSKYDGADKPNGGNKADKESSSVKTTKSSDSYDDLLSDEEKELWKFMNEQPVVIKETRNMKNLGRHILPTKSKKDFIEKAKIVEELNEIPELGFN